MSDVEGDEPMAEVAVAGLMNINTAIQEVLKAALIHDGLTRALHESAKALDGQASGPSLRPGRQLRRANVL
jgi:hypothetical protein